MCSFISSIRNCCDYRLHNFIKGKNKKKIRIVNVTLRLKLFRYNRIYQMTRWLWIYIQGPNGRRWRNNIPPTHHINKTNDFVIKSILKPSFTALLVASFIVINNVLKNLCFKRIYNSFIAFQPPYHMFSCMVKHTNNLIALWSFLSIYKYVHEMKSLWWRYHRLSLIHVV